MIKINLATRKQASTAASTDTAADRTATAFRLDARLDGLKDLPIKQIALLIVVYFASNFVIGKFEADALNEANQAIDKLHATQEEYKKQLAKFANYDNLKKQLDTDEAMITTKIETTKKLIAERQVPPKLMADLSRDIPVGVWLETFKISDDTVSLKGKAWNFGQISDFMKNIAESIYFTDVKFVSAQQARDPSGADVSTFELAAKRRRTN